MQSHPAPKFQAFRLFTFRLDGRLQSKSLDHHHGFAPSVQSRQLQRRFYEWLEHEIPGCLANGRVTHVTFVDDVRKVGDTRAIDSASSAA